MTKPANLSGDVSLVITALNLVDPFIRAEAMQAFKRLMADKCVITDWHENHQQSC